MTLNLVDKCIYYILVFIISIRCCIMMYPSNIVNDLTFTGNMRFCVEENTVHVQDGARLLKYSISV